MSCVRFTFDRLQPDPVHVTVAAATCVSSAQTPDPAAAHEAWISQVSLSSGSTGSAGLATVAWLTSSTEVLVSSPTPQLAWAD
ncbi:hypothetical protein DCC79_10900 [bacterium]|nr:hypothetical protein [Chloroflexi bacterium CFX6]RIL09485.1 MAG: hypothetical protein DCC79_10900 [bacterium]